METLLLIAVVVIFGVSWLLGAMIIGAIYRAVNNTNTNGCMLFLAWLVVIVLFGLLIPGITVLMLFSGTSLNPSGMLIEPDQHKTAHSLPDAWTFGLSTDYFVIRVSDDIFDNGLYEKYWQKLGFSDGRAVSTKHMEYELNRCYVAVADPEYVDYTVASPDQFYPDPDYPDRFVCARSYNPDIPYDVWEGNPRYISIRRVTNGNERLIFMYENGEVVVDER
jgi:hypothetical protein